ncbi:MAG: glycosyltransferase family 2 protein [Candidatus Bathyarchaeia archaeon]
MVISRKPPIYKGLVSSARFHWNKIFLNPRQGGITTTSLHVCVLITTYKRSDLLGYALEGLEKQTYSDFEVLVILKPSGDKTEDVVKTYEKTLRIKLIKQEKGYFVDALNLGLEHAKGDIIAFLDDDAVPFPDWLKNHVETYAKSKVGGVAGNVIQTSLYKKLTTKDDVSEIIPNDRPFLETMGQKIWSQPLQGLENHLVYISKAGKVDYNSRMSHRARHQTVKSMLGMGANMSVLSEAIEGFRFPDSWLPIEAATEQFLGWHIWKRGYNLFFNPHARVRHLVHGQTLSRNIIDTRKEFLRSVGSSLLYYRLYGLEPGLSKMRRICLLIFSVLTNIKKICKDKETWRITRIKAAFYSELIGVKWLLSRKVGGLYSLKTAFERYVKLE